LPEYQLLPPKQIFDLFTKSINIKEFKNDERGMRVVLHKILLETESNSIVMPTRASNLQEAFLSLTSSSVDQNSNANFNNKQYESRYSNANTHPDNNVSTDNNSSNIGVQSEFLVGKERRGVDQLSSAENEVERVKTEMHNLSFQLKSLQSANAELNAKIKIASEQQPKTSNN